MFTLITGASSGIGKELAHVFAQHGHDLILVARDKGSLTVVADDLTKTYRVRALVLPQDLSKSGAAEAIANTLSRKKLDVDILVNNAGFGEFGPFLTTDGAKEHDMISVNIIALTELTKTFLPSMVARGHGRILNVASVVGFQPGPYMAVYYATKAYVLSFSQAIGREVQGTSVTVTALCPGATASQFKERSHQEKSRIFQFVTLTPASRVAEYGYRALLRGKPVAIYGLGANVMIFVERFLPRALVTRIVAWAQRPTV